MKTKLSVDWSVIFWISVIILFLWFLARAIGLFHTPLWVELIPYVTALFTLFAIVKEVGKYAQKFEMIVTDVSEMKNILQGVRQEMHALDKKVAVVEARLQV